MKFVSDTVWLSGCLQVSRDLAPMIDLIGERGWVQPSLQSLPRYALSECFRRAMATGKKAFAGLFLKLNGGQEKDLKARRDGHGVNKVSDVDGRQLSQSSKPSPKELRKEIQDMLETSDDKVWTSTTVRLPTFLSFHLACTQLLECNIYQENMPFFLTLKSSTDGEHNLFILIHYTDDGYKCHRCHRPGISFSDSVCSSSERPGFDLTELH